MSRADLYRVVVANALAAGVDAGTAANAGRAALAGGGAEAVVARDQRALEKLVKPWGTAPEAARAVAREFLAYQARRHVTSQHALLGAVAAKLGIALDTARSVAFAELHRDGTGAPGAPTFATFSALPASEQVRVLDGALDAVDRDEASGFGAGSCDLDTWFSPWAKPTLDALVKRLAPDGRVTMAKRGTLFGPKDASSEAATPGTPEADGYQAFAEYVEIHAVVPSRDELHRVRAFFTSVGDTRSEIGTLATVAARAELHKAKPDFFARGAALMFGLHSTVAVAGLERAFEKNGGLTAKERLVLLSAHGEANQLIARALASPGPFSADWGAVSARLDTVDDLLRILDLRARAALLPFSDKGLSGKDFVDAARVKGALLAQHFESALSTIAEVGNVTTARSEAPTAGEIERAHLALQDLDTMLRRATNEHGFAVPPEWNERLGSLAPMRARIAQLRAFNPLRRPVAD